jgi:hypothetical protein
MNASRHPQTFDALTIHAKGVEPLMGQGEARREVHPATDDLEIANRMKRAQAAILGSC